MRQEIDGGISRGHLLARVAAGTGALAALAASAPDTAPSGTSASPPSRAQDTRILNFLLLLEYLQQDLYAEALAAGSLTGELEQFARVVGAHEREHVAVLREELGSRARGKPAFRFGEALTREGRFAAAALTLEETAVSSYIGQAANLTPARREAVARIVSVEARHAAWIRGFVGRVPAPWVADPAKTPEQAMTTIRRTGFA